MLVNNFRCQILLALGLCVLLLSPELRANGLWGSGAYQGGMICPYETRTANNATSISDDESEARSYVNELRTEQRRADLEMRRLQRRKDTLRRQIGSYFTSSVANFVADTHIDSGLRCNQYRTSNPACNEAAPPAPPATNGDVAGAEATPAPAAPDCSGLMEVPVEELRSKWHSRPGGYCVGDSDANAGAVNGSLICNDTNLRARLPSGRGRSINASECSSTLSEYRTVILELQNAQDRKAELTEQVRQARESIRDLREEARIERELARTEGDFCTDCDEDSRGYSARPRRDWMSTLVNVGAGIGMMYLGRQNERAANEYNAQAGWPSTESYGYPYYQAGISGVINGLVGPGAYGCSSALGANGPQFGVGANGYGPHGAQAGAFGYPPGYQGTPWGGGIYNPGYGINGTINGPNGGFNSGGQFPYNGAMCIMPPCNIAGGGNPYGGNPYGGNPFGGPFNGQFGINIGSPYGQNPYGQNPYGNPYGGGGQFGLNGQLSAQYQMQMLQMQQQQQQQYYQMQQQYYQQQLQQQMQQQQLYAQRQQQAMQIQMQMAQLNAQLQALQQQSYYGGGFNSGGYNNGGLVNGGFNFGAGFNGSFNVGAPSPVGFPGGGGAYNPYQPPNPYQPGLGAPGAYPPGPGGYPPGPGGFPGPYSDPNLGGGIRGR